MEKHILYLLHCHNITTKRLLWSLPNIVCIIKFLHINPVIYFKKQHFCLFSFTGPLNKTDLIQFQKTRFNLFKRFLSHFEMDLRKVMIGLRCKVFTLPVCTADTTLPCGFIYFISHWRANNIIIEWWLKQNTRSSAHHIHWRAK